MYAALCIVSVAMCSRNPKYVVKQPVNKDADQSGESQLKKAEDESVVTLKDALSSWKFWLLSLLLF